MHAARRSCIRYASAVVARFGASLLLLLCACSNDTFVGGQDASADAASDGEGVDVGQPDVRTIEGSTGTFCSLHGEAFFCDDWDEPSEGVGSKWSTTTPTPPGTAITLGVGVSGKGVVMKAAATSNAFLTKQAQNNALLGLAFDMKIESVTASTTYVRIQASTKTFTIATDVTTNLTVTGDSGGAQQLTQADTNWHHYDVVFAKGVATVTQDGGTHATSASYSPQAPTSSTLDIGIVTGVLGGTVAFDNVLLR
jgi:hypothetical protein